MKKLSLQQIFDRAEKVNYGLVKDYIENKNLDGKSYLGSGAEGIKKIPLKINLHHSFCNPQEVIDEIEEKMKNKTVIGYYQNGKYLFDVIISEFRVNVKQLLWDSIVYAEIDVTLLESVDMPEISTVFSLPLQTFSSDSGIVQKFVENAKNLQYQNVISQVVKMSASDNLSSSAQQIFNNFKDSLINVFANEGLSKVYDNVSQYIDSLEQNPNLEYLEKEMIKYALKKVSKSLTLGYIRQPVDDVVIESYALTDSSSQQWIMPCEGTITDTFRIRDKHPVTGQSNVIHDGIDIDVKVGTPVRAVYDGKIVVRRTDSKGINRGYGKFIVLQHNVNGKIVTSEYGHLSEWNKKLNIGDYVKKGQVIAFSGNTGYSTNPHLHLAIRIGVYKGIPADPKEYIRY